MACVTSTVLEWACLALVLSWVGSDDGALGPSDWMVSDLCPQGCMCDETLIKQPHTLRHTHTRAYTGTHTHTRAHTPHAQGHRDRHACTCAHTHRGTCIHAHTRKHTQAHRHTHRGTHKDTEVGI